MNFANQESAKQIVGQLYPGSSIRMVEHGYDNLVILVDDRYAVRFPRRENPYKRSLYERELLKSLDSIKSLIIPKFVAEHDNPPYVVTTFVPGEHTTSFEINEDYSVDQQRDMAEKLAEFAFELHSTLSLEKETEMRVKFDLDNTSDEPWPVFFRKLLKEPHLPDPIQAKIALQYYERWNEVANKKPTTVIHDDLHTQNLMFVDKKLVGVIDFGDTNIGIPEQELRQLYRISEPILKYGIKRYEELSGQQLDIETAKLWAITQELATYTEKLLAGDFTHPSFARTAKSLNNWLPEGHWGEGMKVASLTGQ